MIALRKILVPHDFSDTSEAAVRYAIALAHSDADEENASGPLILCADTSLDVLSYLRALLREAGHRVVTTQNFYDGLILLKTMRPSVVMRTRAGSRKTSMA